MSIEKIAWSGWIPFRKRMDEIWYKFDSVEAILEEDFKKEDEKFRVLFLKAKYDYEKFLTLIRKYWEENYHIVVNSYNELIEEFIKFNQMQRGGIIYISLLPEVEDCKLETMQSKDEAFSITKEFYQSIIKTMDDKKSDMLRIFSKKYERIFLLKLREFTDDGLYRIIGIMELKDVIIVD